VARRRRRGTCSIFAIHRVMMRGCIGSVQEMVLEGQFVDVRNSRVSLDKQRSGTYLNWLI